MIRPPQPLDLTRPCPLVLLEPALLTDGWTRLADRNHIVLATVPSPEKIKNSLDEACRKFPIDAQKKYLVGASLQPEFLKFHDEIAQSTAQIDPEIAWKELKTSHVTAIQHSTLSIIVTGLRNTKGIIAAQLFLGEESFKNRKELANVIGEILPDKTALLKFEKLEHGTYAVLLLHDENKNGKLDTGPFGIPKEGFGASRDPKVRFGPPRWKNCQFLLTNASGERELTVKAMYL